MGIPPVASERNFKAGGNVVNKNPKTFWHWRGSGRAMRMLRWTHAAQTEFRRTSPRKPNALEALTFERNVLFRIQLGGSWEARESRIALTSSGAGVKSQPFPSRIVSARAVGVALIPKKRLSQRRFLESAAGNGGTLSRSMNLPDGNGPLRAKAAQHKT